MPEAVQITVPEPPAVSITRIIADIADIAEFACSSAASEMPSISRPIASRKPVQANQARLTIRERAVARVRRFFCCFKK